MDRLMIDVAGLYGVLKVKMLALVSEFAPARDRRALVQQTAASEGRVDFEAWLNGNLMATVTLDGEGIDFVCYQGIHGRLYPDFVLEPQSMRRTLTGEAIDVAVALRTLRVSFREADDVRLVDDRDTPDEETFVVDPDTEQDLIEVHHT
ncbi:hypothetical protein KDX23_22785 [Burkholderia vietnamiensis]|uniref:hypothetical protein n=1 Tax=Burkholderia vietnamiensis TaxID=60552 RepID=UPI001B9AA391|nr:hypothetical protein [Burkholderia vietnamiensis]MBR8085565.1 hypothetical protein [Burkholderia vietnamiensis]